MKNKVEEFDNWLLAKTQQLVSSILKEEYEKAAQINNDIDTRIDIAIESMKKYNLPHEELKRELIEAKNDYIEIWEDHYDFPKEKRIK